MEVHHVLYIYPKKILKKRFLSNNLRSHLTPNQKDHLEKTKNFQIPIIFFLFPVPSFDPLWVFTAKAVVEN